MRHRHSMLCLTLTAAITAACGGSRSPAVTGGERQNTVRVSNDVGGGGTQLITTSAYRGLVDSLEVPADSAWRLMPAVYTDLGINFTTLDQAGRVIGNDALALRQRLGKVPLSRYVSCGGENGRDNADSYAVTMSVRSRIVPDSAASGATVATTVQATARSLLFNSGEVECTSTQRLEDEVAKRLKEKIGA